MKTYFFFTCLWGKVAVKSSKSLVKMPKSRVNNKKP